MDGDPGIYSFLLLKLLIIILLRSLYVAHVYLHQIEKGFESSPMVKDLDVYLIAGLAGKVFKCCMISYIFLFPLPYARRGLINIEDVHNFPSRLKVTFLLPYYSMFLGGDHFEVLEGVKYRMSMMCDSRSLRPAIKGSLP